MKQKFGIKIRVFLSFSIFIILIINIFSFFLYFFTIKNFKKSLEKDLITQAGVIKSFIDLDKNHFNILPNEQVEQINNLGFFFYIGKDDNNEYKDGLFIYKNELIFKELYKNYTIILGKDITDFKKLESKFIDIVILLNVLSLFFTFIISYLITRQVLEPLIKLSNYFSNFDIYNSHKLIVNNYGESEIGKLNKSINNFIKETKNIFDSQKSFIQDTSHELKTPLMQIESSLDLIKDNNLESKDKLRLNKIRTSLNNINEIISNISFILRGDEKIIKNEKININNYFEDFIKKYKNLAETKNIKIILNCINNFEINSNIYYLDRLFGNLLSNSIFYNEGNNNIIIGINKNYIYIIDEGIGIKKEDIDKIFNRFYRSKNSKIYSRDGNGLGLSIVKKICELFKWKIYIDSEKLIGTRIKIIFHK